MPVSSSHDIAPPPVKNPEPGETPILTDSWGRALAHRPSVEDEPNRSRLLENPHRQHLLENSVPQRIHKDTNPQRLFDDFSRRSFLKDPNRRRLLDDTNRPRQISDFIRHRPLDDPNHHIFLNDTTLQRILNDSNPQHLFDDPNRRRLPDDSNTLPPIDYPYRQRLQLDDPDVRLAAEALGDLRADFISPPSSNRTSQSPRAERVLPRSEPLLSLLTTSHPLVASTIGGASSAYGGAKNLSPRFKSGAEYVEGYLTPIANTVNSVGRVTGVEGGVRWFLGANRRSAALSDQYLEEAYSHKRRKVRDGGDNDDDDGGGYGGGAPHLNMWSTDPRTLRRLSTSTIDTLPLYDDMRSPAYTEEMAGSSPSASRSGPWQSRLMLSTSGLSVAMSAESLRSLKYCLRWLRWTNDHMGRVIGTLKATIEEYEKTRPPGPPDSSPVQDPEPSRVELVNRMNSLKSDIVKTLQSTIDTVSKYAGGALPENARVLVRRHLTSLPQRFRIAIMSTDGDDEGRDGESAISEGAQKVLVLAKEGLDMVTQVSGVVDGTIMSAEEWCERMDRKRQSPRDEEEQQQEPAASMDAKMG